MGETIKYDMLYNILIYIIRLRDQNCLKSNENASGGEVFPNSLSVS